MLHTFVTLFVSCCSCVLFSPWTIESIDDIPIAIHHKSRWATRVICTNLANQHLATVHVDFFHWFPRKDGFEATIFGAGFQATCFFLTSWGFHGDCWLLRSWFHGTVFGIAAMIYRGKTKPKIWGFVAWFIGGMNWPPSKDTIVYLVYQPTILWDG